ncbi:MAG: hypothetical protein H7246_23430 [Phycisphaerae bacterium]|nr:hypothetical protein [Saprospiraceae bacterium]
MLGIVLAMIRAQTSVAVVMSIIALLSKDSKNELLEQLQELKISNGSNRDFIIYINDLMNEI